MMTTIYLIFGILLFLFPLLPKPRLWRFRKNGEKCEGRIYRIEYFYNDEGGKSVSRIIVQFTTKNGKLITSDLDLSGGGFWSSFEEGHKVSVIYDVTQPTRFTLTQLPSDPLLNAACIIGGLFFLVFWA